ncbi:DUF1236 domain-containing protein [Bradyrhizobium sp. U87765 SZCCT0131]|uniref:DUF1236 domain-containing protein n=1 Tax=unclassified Bradyrhizobium TaxID=2631580 RepID=UPI001BAADCAF|nr:MULTISPECIES: DUF1236 domain-containing protein [unclassified Bradyrhizobium]MBR1218116.1 DUF1236 domain-containing protein [Bradyrhizobium sp. U87765 SZCCT0131]MBR1260938.1 DUF1236 domain-containing protein [Bradyrhizobium sp. U87765 SZCCT0134]MBR1303614.1 DUF1236 domain-containing protein [Bradyrhizobium sp. U87765 SZCCT0110]MBR1319220.1 DUF1236 domain-containing protein [Bradyrhizobium sp. U87765 SZCCT0109]MBR1347545.1 DUF1236 domain-containing protein [Bradyrhizobium sp. U87765 SZCCT004
MRKMFVLAAMVAIAAPIAAHAQGVVVEEHVTTGYAGAPLVGGVISDVQRPRFRRYIVEEQVPSYAIDGPVSVGTVLPDSGVTYYDVPQQFGPTTFRYTVVNDHSILVDPRSRRVMQVIE